MRYSLNTLRMAVAMLVVGCGLQFSSGQDTPASGNNNPPAATNEPKKEEPKADEPKKDEPKTEPKKDDPTSDESKKDEPKTDKPKQDDPVVPPPPGNGLIPNRPAFFMNVAVNKTSGSYNEGERLSVRFKSERDAHVYLLYHQADGSAVMIFPNKAQTSNLVKAKEEVLIPKTGDNFLFRVTAPFGEEALQVVASEEPIESLDKLDPSANRAVPVPKQVLADLASTIKGSPGKFAEHRTVIHTHKGVGPLPEPRTPARFGFFFGASKLNDAALGKEDPILGRNAEFMTDLFIELGGIPKDNTKTRVGKQATLEEFRDAVTKWLPSVSQPGDTIIIFYAGHGGQVPAKDGSEPDGKDEILTTFDYDSKRPYETAIVDDELARWLQELPGRQIAMMMETCHGGGLVDGTGMSHLMRDDAIRCHDLCQLNSAIVTACLPEEYSIFYPSQEHTIMPTLIGEAMRTLPRPVSIGQAFEYYRQKLPAAVGAGNNRPEYPQQPSLTNFSPLPIILVPAGPAPPNGESPQ